MDSTNASSAFIDIPKIKRGSQITIGKRYSMTINIDHHFNWFQKRLIKWCFGCIITDYSED